MNLREAFSADGHTGLSAARLRLIGGVYFALLIVVGLWLWQRWAGAFTTRAVDDVASLLGVLFATGCAALAAWSARGRMRRGWLAMTAGLLGWAVGEGIWSYYEVVLRYEQAPYPSWADAFYLLFPVGAGAAVVLLSPGTSGRSRIRVVLDGLIVAASLFLVSWVSVIQSVFDAGGDSRLALAVSLAYPVADVVIITIAWASVTVAYRPSMGMLIVGLIIIAGTDSVFSALTAVNDYYTGNLIDLGWIAGCGILGVAALRSIGEPPREQRPGANPSQALLFLPYLPLVLASGVAMAQVLPRVESFPLAATVFLLVITVLARQFVAMAEHQRLLTDVGRLAFTDQLTGLANRALFLDRLEQAIARQQRERLTLTVLCLDLDGFKAVNDQLGHPAGDELLIRVAGRLSASVRSTDTVARLGGDEFAILIEGPVEDTIVAADRIFDAFAEPIVVDGVTLAVRPSVGLTLATSDMPQTSVTSLIRQADLAMYAAKRDGGACLRSFVPDFANPYELPRRSPVTIEPPATPPVDATVDDAGEFTEQRPEAIQERAAWPPMGVRIGLAALTTGLVVFALSTVIRERPGRIVLIDNWLESSLMLLAAGLVAARSWRVACRALGLATDRHRNVGHRVWHRRVRDVGARGSITVAGRSAFPGVLSACLRGVAAPDSPQTAVRAPGDPNRRCGGRAHRCRRGRRGRLGAYPTRDHRSTGRCPRRTRVSGRRAAARGTHGWVAGHLGVANRAELGAARRRLPVVCHRQHDLSLRGSARLGIWRGPCSMRAGPAPSC